MSETPRADFVGRSIDLGDDDASYAELARQLERDLAQAREELAQIRTKIAERDKSDPIHRLHNLCDALDADKAASPYSEEAWQQQEDAYREKCAELAQAREELAHAKSSVGLWHERVEKAEAELAELRPQIALDRAMIEDQGQRLDALQAERDAAVKDAERYRKCRRNGGFFFTSDFMTDDEIDAHIDSLEDYNAIDAAKGER